MIDPTRLRKDSESDLERALLDAGVSYKVTSRTRAKTLAALGLAGSATLLAGTAAATSLSSAAKLTWMKLVAGVTLVGAVAAVPVGYQMWQKHEDARRSAVVATGPASTVTEAPAADRLSLTRELAALDAARAALARGESRTALAQLDAYAQNHPYGRLALEAEVLRIDALARGGQREAANARAEAFLRRHPNSVLASRVRAHVQPTE